MTPRALPRRADSGFTVIELAVSGALMGLLSALVMATLAGGLRTAARGETRTDEAGQAQLALQALNADVRSAVRICAGGRDWLNLLTRVATTDRGPGGLWAEEVQYGYATAGGQLRRKRTLRDPTDPAYACPVTPLGATEGSAILTGVLPVATAGRPLFRLLSIEDSRVQCNTGPTSGSLGDTATDPAVLARVYAVDVWVSVNRAPHLSRSPLVLAGGAVVANRTVPDDTQPSPPPADIRPAPGSLGLGQGCT